MTVYLVRSSLADIPEAAVRDAVCRYRDISEQLRRSGHHVRFLGSMHVADDGFCGGLFEASSADEVRLATELAAVPYDDIVATVLLDAAARRVEDHHWIGGNP